MFSAPSSGHPLIWLTCTGRTARRGPTQPYGPSWDKPNTKACSPTSYRRHRVRTAFDSDPSGRQAQSGRLGRVRPEGDPTHKECAVTPEKTDSDQRPKEPVEDAGPRPEKLGSLDVWARSAPIPLAGYEEDLAEPHIRPSVD